jgi:hypothetical protein
VLAILLGVSAIVAAISVFPNASEFFKGFIPTFPDNVKHDEIFPWLGFMLSGAAGLIWYSYWLQAKGYGMEKQNGGAEPASLTASNKQKLRKWIAQMTADSSVAVGGTLVITLSFLILGTELLKPKGLIPEENKVAEVLGQMLGHLWGPIGFWFMITAVFVGFWDTVLSDQDGFGRMFTGGTRLLMKRSGVKAKWATEKVLNRIAVVGLVTIAPIGLYLIMGEPVSPLKIAGAVEAAHIPVLVVLVLYLNKKKLAPALQPSTFTFVATALAGIFFAAFAIVYVMQLTNSSGN